MEKDIKAETKNIIFREIGTGDEEMINSFFDLMGGETRAFFNRRDYNRRGVLKYIARPDATRKYWVAMHEGKMIGYVFFLDFNTKEKIPQDELDIFPQKRYNRPHKKGTGGCFP